MHSIPLCFLQDVIYAKDKHKSLYERASIATTSLEKAYICLIRQHGDMTYEYLDAFAHIRNGLLIAGEALHEESSFPINASLLSVVQKLCTNQKINRISDKVATGPNIFLLKVLARSYNMSVLKTVARRHTWLLPQQLMSEV